MGLRSAIARAALLVGAPLALLAPSAAEAASVVNGNFESGTLNGWHVQRLTGAGNWFVRSSTAAPIGSKRPNPADPVQPPPQGAFAAIADQANPDTLILYQDVALEAGSKHQLSLFAYYDSYRPIAVPNPDTLSIEDEALRLPNGKFQPNQQFRIDVVRPEAPLESLASTDILRTVFATKLGDPLSMTPKKLTTDLSAFAGQTVRIRIAVTAREEVLNAGVDAVSISSSTPGRAGPGRGNRKPALFSFEKFTAQRRSGAGTLRVRVSGPGLLRATGVSSAAGSGKGSPAGQIEPVTVPVGVARTVGVHLRPTAQARTLLRRRHRLRVDVAVTFMPAGLPAETATLPVVFRLTQSSK